MSKENLKKIAEENLLARKKELEKDAINLERRADTAKTELRDLQEEKSKEQKRKVDGVSDGLKALEKDLRDRQRLLIESERNFTLRSDNLKARELRVANIAEREKDLREKAIAVEQRRVDAEIAHRKISEESEKVSTRLNKAIHSEKTARDEHKANTEDRERNEILKETKEQSIKDFEIAKKSYELIKKEIDPKLMYVKEKEKLIAGREEDLKEREQLTKSTEQEQRKMVEFLSNKKEALDSHELKLKEREMDINVKAMRAQVN